MSDQYDIDRTKRQLDNISDTMCYAKWAQVSMHLTNGMTQSCYHPPTHKVDLDQIAHDPSALHNTDQKWQEREQMLKGERPAGCSYCWKIEDSGGTSDRVYRSGEYWAQNARKDIIASTQTQRLNPRYVEVNFNQACNFKCIYCSPHLSTTWEEEVKKNGAFKIYDQNNNLKLHNDLNHLTDSGLMPLKVAQKDNPYLEAFWKWWPDLYKTLEVFRMTGGEPLMDSNTFRVLDYIYENPNAWLELSITTNMCPPRQDLWTKFLEKVQRLEQIQIWHSNRWNPGSGNNWYVNMAVKHLSLFVSLDSVGQHAEYIRPGLNFQQLSDNVTDFLDNTLNASITFINTFNVLSVTTLTDYLKFILSLREKYSQESQGLKYIPVHDPNQTHPDHAVYPRQKVWFDIPLLRDPAWLCINILPESFNTYLEDAIKFMEANRESGNFVGFYDFEINKVKRNLEWMNKERKFDNHMDIKNLDSYTRQIDQRYGTNMAAMSPEIHDLIKDIL
jgi:hypothetical protein